MASVRFEVVSRTRWRLTLPRQRRDVLRASTAGGLATVPLAGCTGQSGDESDEGGPSDGSDGQDGTDETDAQGSTDGADGSSLPSYHLF